MTDLSTLRTQMNGPVTAAGDDGYDEARKVYNFMIDRRPEAVAQCTSTADVVAVVNYARETGADLAVRGDDLRREDVVDAESVAACEVADPSAEGQSSDPGGADDPPWRGQSVRAGGLVQVVPGRPTLCVGDPCLRVDTHLAHAGKVGDDGVISGAEARHTV